MPELSLAKRTLGSRKNLSSFEFSADHVPRVGYHDGRKTIHSCERSCIEGGELLSGLPQHSHFTTDKILNG